MWYSQRVEAPEVKAGQGNPVYKILAWLAAPNLLFLAFPCLPEAFTDIGIAVALLSPLPCGVVAGIHWTRSLGLEGGRRFVVGMFVCLAMIVLSIVIGIPGCSIGSALLRIKKPPPENILKSSGIGPVRRGVEARGFRTGSGHH